MKIELECFNENENYETTKQNTENLEGKIRILLEQLNIVAKSTSRIRTLTHSIEMLDEILMNTTLNVDRALLQRSQNLEVPFRNLFESELPGFFLFTHLLTLTYETFLTAFFFRTKNWHGNKELHI